MDHERPSAATSGLAERIGDGVSTHSARTSGLYLWRRAVRFDRGGVRSGAKEILMKRLLASIVQFCARARIGCYLPGILLLIPTLAMLGMTVAQGHSSSFEADDSDEWRQQVQGVLRDTEKSFAQFRAMRQRHNA
jgi:hypothetical protein